MVGHLLDHGHGVGDAELDLGPDLDDPAVVGDELLGRDGEGGGAHVDALAPVRVYCHGVYIFPWTGV